MQVAATGSPNIFNFQSAGSVRAHPASEAPGSTERVGDDSSEGVVFRLPEPKFDQTVEEATRITTALIAALNSGERVGQLLQEIV